MLNRKERGQDNLAINPGGLLGFGEKRGRRAQRRSSGLNYLPYYCNYDSNILLLSSLSLLLLNPHGNILPLSFKYARLISLLHLIIRSPSTGSSCWSTIHRAPFIANTTSPPFLLQNTAYRTRIRLNDSSLSFVVLSLNSTHHLDAVSIWINCTLVSDPTSRFLTEVTGTSLVRLYPSCASCTIKTRASRMLAPCQSTYCCLIR